MIEQIKTESFEESAIVRGRIDSDNLRSIATNSMLIIMCVIRELLGSGTFGGGILNGGEGIRIIPEGYPAMQMVMPVGGFLTLGFVVAGYQWFMRKLRNKKKEGAK